MTFVLSKILIVFLKPLLWATCLLLAGFIVKKTLVRKQLLISGFLVLIIFSNSFIIGECLNAYEADYPKLEKYDFGILLGGFSAVNPRNQELRANESGDRLVQTISLYKRGIIRKILISGGNGSLIDTTNKEANVVLRYLNTIGIPDSSILLEEKSRNTIENASYSYSLTQKLNPKAKVLIITSAWHIPRAKMIFSKSFKSDIEYYPTDYLGNASYSWSDFIIPSASALNRWELLLKEWVGLFVDNFRS